jgi:Phosphoribosylaminoimidazolesuccinocarboxamide (SAICAR) synthase
MTDYDLPPDYEHIYSGKVRDLFRTPDDRLLFVASDRISAYDWVLPSLIPDKGQGAHATLVVGGFHPPRGHPTGVM